MTPALHYPLLEPHNARSMSPSEAAWRPRGRRHLLANDRAIPGTAQFLAPSPGDSSRHSICNKLDQHKPHATRTGIKLALLAQNDPISSILHTQGELCPVCVANKPSRANFFARRTRRRGDCETTITTAHPQTAITETGGTTATEKRTKYTHFSPAKATPVSVEALPTRAKAMAVSTGAPYWPAKAMAVSIRRK